MSDKREYPEIEFVETDTETIEGGLISAYEYMTGRVVYPADPVRVFIAWLADIIVQQRVIINEKSKQNILRYATGEYLDALSEVFKDIYRLPEQPAKTTFKFYISQAKNQPVFINAGTRVTVDGEIIFATEETLEIKPGETSGEVTGVCLISGEIGNGFKPGQIREIIDVFSYYLKVENITESSGGADKESDDAFYERIRDSQESYSTAGPEGAYIYHAKSASPLISDVSPISPEEGVVDVRVLLKNSTLPGEEVLNLVKEALDDKKVRPMTDKVIVSAPEKVNFDIEVQYYIPRPSASSIKIIEKDVTSAIDEYIIWQTEKMGRDINPSKLISLIMSKGVKRVDVIKPIFKVVDDGCVAFLKNKKVTNGGVEDE